MNLQYMSCQTELFYLIKNSKFSEFIHVVY